MRIDSWRGSSWNLLWRVLQHYRLKRITPKSPVTFAEKVRYRMLYDRREILKTFADKYRVRDYVRHVAGEQYLAQILDVAERPEKIQWNQLPRNFVAKVNHGSGGIIGVWGNVETSAKLPQSLSNLGWSQWWVHPENFDSGIANSLFDYWLRQNYAYRYLALPEWAYESIQRCVFVEELLTNANNTIASPHGFFVFNGKTKVVRITGRDSQSNRYMAYVDVDWNKLDVRQKLAVKENEFLEIPKAPNNFKEMVTLAEALAGDMDFVRVDLYNVSGRIVFSEMTIYPSAGRVTWDPEEYELEMGKVWNLSVK